MTFKKTFCSSPWFHVGIQPQGEYLACRWSDKDSPYYRFLPTGEDANIATTSILEYFDSDTMRKFRGEFLDGSTPELCKSCYYEDGFNKLSGRARQLLKSGIRLADFDNTLLASPQYQSFEYSQTHAGAVDREPTDFQIELGSLCNSACVMCSPAYSSRLAEDFRKLEQIDSTQFKLPPIPKNWTDDPALVQGFVDQLVALANTRYIHFLGGETMYIEAFYTICEGLIKAGVSKNIIIGTTTNCTIYHHRVENLIQEFKEFHLGISIETLNTVNDYIRWPSRIDDIKTNLYKFLDLRKQNPNLQISLRITPNIFTVYYIDELIDFMFENNVIAESCNILRKPSVLRMELMPEELRLDVIGRLEQVIARHQLVATEQVINLRDNHRSQEVIANVANEYLTVLRESKIPADAEAERYQLVKFLKAWEQLRGNSILDHAPEYEDFLRLYGY